MAKAEKTYPMVPAKTWWALRERFKKSMPGELSTTYLASVLGGSEKKAQNLMPALRALGLITPEGKTTPRANHWRMDEEYPAVCAEMLKEIYPQELRDAAPDPVKDSRAAITWFMKKTGVGNGAAVQMNSVLRLLAKGNPAEGAEVAAESGEGRNSQRQGGGRVSRDKRQPSPPSSPRTQEVQTPNPHTPSRHQALALHIDIQIHLGADLTPEQVDTIFASMAKHLYDQGRRAD